MGNSAAHSCGYVALDSPASADGSAISAIRLRVESEQAADAALAELGWAPLAVGGFRLSDLLGIDRGLVIRWSPTTIHITPHGGALITARLLAAFGERGFTPESSRRFSMDCYPEAADLIEACALDAIASSHSPIAIDVIMRQVKLWRAPAQNLTAPHATEVALNRLLHPPRIVLLGAPNIGKSTLTNALAGRMVSLVADEAGVTRDHVGVCLELDGLSVLWIDAPGMADHAPTDIDRAAQEIAMEAATTADLVLLCGDATCSAPTGGAHGRHCRGPVLRVGLRADLGLMSGSDLCVSAGDRSSLERLAVRIRQLLVPDPDLTCQSRWRFHRALPAS